jgi:hypothetical protein
MNMIFIYIILVLFIALMLFGWFYSPRTRKLARFTILFIIAAAILIGVIVFIRVTWFPLPPF